MGTNYYAKFIPTEEDIEIAHSLVNKRKFNELSTFISKFISPVHLCKQSGGWKIVFDHNWGDYYQPNRKSITEFLSQPNIQIEDEYGEPFTVDEFWEQMDEWNESSFNSLDGKTYYEKDKSAHYFDSLFKHDTEMCKKLWNVEPEYGDFLSDGLRFSVSSDFC